ncbi:hypothetical protein BT96DRAFT_931746 [Gymnopus androsaceus JB14]|uniref:Uncharacterized protein n=1 Tax=Gymnopus androsaceus JB14 TaxID=1447944 RepID=A0A6A4IBQ9_9AGAR|nr:hypothetical protein BT96DRAFT_931746 [Gymnopus androsaceus JB14]
MLRVVELLGSVGASRKFLSQFRNSTSPKARTLIPSQARKFLARVVLSTFFGPWLISGLLARVTSLVSSSFLRINFDVDISSGYKQKQPSSEAALDASDSSVKHTFTERKDPGIYELPISSPVRNVPPEILSKIFDHYIFEVPDGHSATSAYP